MEGFILAGGKSSRMGTAKGELLLGGISMLDRAADALSSVCLNGITVVGGQGMGVSDLTLIDDGDFNDQHISGPLVGVHAALTNAQTDWIAVLACDLPFVSPELFETLALIDRTDFDAVVPIQPDGRAQPLCALYRRDACRMATLDLINDHDLSMRSLLRAVETRFVPFTELGGLKNAEHVFMNVNTRDEYDKALNIAGMIRP